MLRLLIAAFWLIVVGSIVGMLGKEIKITHKKQDLVTDVQLENNTTVQFKLSLDANRPKLRRRNCKWFCKLRNDYNTETMQVFNGSDCLSGSPTDRTLVTSLAFNKDLLVQDVQLIESADYSTRTFAPYQGLLGLNWASACADSQPDSEALINRMRDKDHGFTIDIPRLVFGSGFNKIFYSEYSEGWFTIKGFTIAKMAIARTMEAKIDLNSNLVKVPSGIFSQMQNYLGSETATPNEIDGREYFTTAKEKVERLSIRFAHGPPMDLPLKPFFHRRRFFSVVTGMFYHRVETIFEPHSKPYWSLGLKFLDHFKVSFDLERGEISFQPKGTFE